jgi:hypothetical protein
MHGVRVGPVLPQSSAMEGHHPMAPARLQCAIDCCRVRGRSFEGDRQILMFSALTSESPLQDAVLVDFALDYRRALEWIEAEILDADRHQALCRRTTRRVRWHHRAGPATL